jgi:hypothetical protein
MLVKNKTTNKLMLDKFNKEYDQLRNQILKLPSKFNPDLPADSPQHLQEQSKIKSEFDYLVFTKEQMMTIMK